MTRRREERWGKLELAAFQNRITGLAPAVPEIQAVLEDGEVVVSTLVEANELYHVCIRRDFVRLMRSAFSYQRFFVDYKLVLSALRAVHAPSLGMDRQYPVGAAVRIYQTLLGPLNACVQTGDHIFWLPDAAIASLPISALLVEAPPREGEGYDLTRGEWLATRNSVSYPGSTRALVAARNRSVRLEGGSTLLGVGDPLLAGSTEDGSARVSVVVRGAVTSRGAGLESLAELPETSDELRRIASVFPGDARLLLREKATEEEFLDAIQTHPSYIVFSTHGLMREEIPGIREPALVLTAKNGLKRGEDGLLTASEIADLSLSARLVVLSACNSGAFDPAIAMVGLYGLTSAFSVAGVPATVATLWSVDSRASRELMGIMFSELAKGGATPVEEALRRAQLQLIHGRAGVAQAHPRFWAAFALFGDAPRRGLSN
jgi:CHAT domain-containing protein